MNQSVLPTQEIKVEKVENVAQQAVNITKKEEIELAYKVAALIDIDYSNLTENQIKAFWLINNFELGIVL